LQNASELRNLLLSIAQTRQRLFAYSHLMVASLKARVVSRDI
jgi:hypothetical protein